MTIYKTEPYGQLERIKELMENTVDENGKKGITQEKLATEIGIDKSNVNKWFKKGVKIRKNNLQKIADYLKCDIEFLTCEQDYPKRTNGSRMKLSKIPKTDVYLEKIQNLMKTTKNSFNVYHGWETETFNEYQDYFIEDNVKYYYENIFPNYDGPEVYEFRFADGSTRILTPTEAEEFVKDIVKFISYKTEILKNN